MIISARGKLLIEEAFRWMNLGVSVVPAHPRSKIVTVRWRSYDYWLPSKQSINTWFRLGLNNIAVVCGSGGLQVLDFDNLEKYFTWKQKAGALANTYSETTGRGVHLFYLVDQAQTQWFDECEALGLGHLCVVHPSIHPSSAVYTPIGDPTTPIIRIERQKLFSLLSKTEMGDEPKQGEIPSKSKVSGGQGGAAALAGSAGGHDLLSKIKAAQPLQDYISQFTQLKPSGQGGRYMVGRCPFHDDESPSLWVDCQRGIWRCFSPGCRASRGGDLVNFYALQNDIDNRQAIARLAREVLP